MPDTTIRDQLADLIDDDLTRQVKVHASYISHFDQHELADAVIAAGWRPPARIAEPYVPDLVAEREAREEGVRIGELEGELKHARARIAELEQASQPLGYVTGYHAEDRWHIEFDGPPFNREQAIADLHEAATEVPDVEWHALEVRRSDLRDVSDHD